MYNFTFDTESITDVVDTKPDYDSFFLIGLKDDAIFYDAGVKPGFEKDFTAMVLSLREDVLMDDILSCLPNILEHGDEIVESLIDNLTEDDELIEDMEHFDLAMERTAICQPALIFSREHHHDHDGE